MIKKRVVITGYGAVTPCGLNAKDAFESVLHAKSACRIIESFEQPDWPVRIAAEIDWNPEEYLDKKSIRRMDRYTQFAMVAATEAIKMSGLATDAPLGERAGVYIGSGIGGIGEISRGALRMNDRGPRALGALFIPKSLSNLATGHVAMTFGAKGPSLVISTACATGNHSIGEAFRCISNGDADIIIAGGAEAAIEPLGFAGFMNMRALSKRNDDPVTASRPFDLNRDGFVMGEGAGVLVLESLEHALERGAKIYTEITGYAITNDAHHISAPPARHEGAARCMTLALKSAGLSPEDIDYINAHGTSTPQNDKNECMAIRDVFGPHTDDLMVSSTKGCTGHLLGAAGGIEAVFSVMALDQQIVPPTANLHQQDPECDLDIVPNHFRKTSLRSCMSNAFGFGGTNAVLIFQNKE